MEESGERVEGPKIINTEMRQLQQLKIYDETVVVMGLINPLHIYRISYL